jgi:hypothetical protein
VEYTQELLQDTFAVLKKRSSFSLKISKDKTRLTQSTVDEAWKYFNAIK